MQEAFITKFEVNPHIWVDAEIPEETNTVYLWLGANTMVEYELEEAFNLLTTNLEKAKVSLEKTEADLDAVKDNVTVAEVSMYSISKTHIRYCSCV